MKIEETIIFWRQTGSRYVRVRVRVRSWPYLCVGRVIPQNNGYVLPSTCFDSNNLLMISDRGRDMLSIECYSCSKRGNNTSCSLNVCILQTGDKFSLESEIIVCRQHALNSATSDRKWRSFTAAPFIYCVQSKCRSKKNVISC